MARATRSATHHQEKDKQIDQAANPRGKASTKKRKRTSLAETDEQPATKQLRAENGLKQEGTPDSEEPLSKIKVPDLEPVADVPIDPLDAQKILDILELIDTQGLLDRVFPLPSSNPSEPSTSNAQTGTYSFRALLKESSQYPLRVLRSAIQHLVPISSHLRSRPSSPASQQLRFCNLALSLLDQASFHSVPLSLDVDTILADAPLDEHSNGKPTISLPTAKSPYNQARKYALMQRLPTGTWWTSLNSDLVPADGKGLQDLLTANAELVAVLPSASSQENPSDGSSITPIALSVPTLGSYAPKKPPGHKSRLPGPRRVGCGSFLDYGPFASFAPAFEQDGVEIGRSTLGEVYSRWEDRKRMHGREKVRLSERLELEDAPMQGIQGGGARDMSDCIDPNLDMAGPPDDLNDLDGLLTPEQTASLKGALGNLQLEDAVQELLDRNSRALKRLEELQALRLKASSFVAVEEGSEEMEIARSILDSLVLLASLRPRSSTSEAAPLVPSASTLRKLHHTLPVTPTQGWYGTLPADRTSALRDDSTLYIKSNATAVVANPPAVPTPPPTTTQPAPQTPASAQNYQGYAPYSTYATPYRGGYSYKPGQATTYYPSAYTTQAQGQIATQYYPNQYNTTGQQQFSYSSWYSYQPQNQAQSSTAAGSSSGRGTPQPSTTPTTVPTSYAGFFNATSQGTGGQQRAVANTVTMNAGKPLQQSWATGNTGIGTSGYVPPTLPPHLRNAAGGTSQPGTPGGYGGSYQPTYYGSYQATPAPAQ
ncbi:hypothetical protein BJ138DRAFT_1079332 [Hygrophoropsis aurantiaca]|uniref:Uncharacterized protein n=1 Tax=Hygrophoropsis aurantiaca TaxID=72124 RepID=A0ACB8ANE3_9AGAM|nr:hypothetical protein BJ138DRAFT_1079332 [Hygrophoropsis aurantiaca]